MIIKEIIKIQFNIIIFSIKKKKNVKINKSLEIINYEKVTGWFSYYFITIKINNSENIPFILFNELFIHVNNPILSFYILKDTIKYI